MNRSVDILPATRQVEVIDGATTRLAETQTRTIEIEDTSGTRLVEVPGRALDIVHQSQAKLLDVPGRSVEIIEIGRVVVNTEGGGVTDHGTLTGLSDDDHPQYLTQARGDGRYDALGVHAAGMAAHLAAGDPHPQYLTPAEASAAFSALGHGHVMGDVSGLTAALAAKADLASPSLTGTPLAPTAATGTNTTQIATTAFVQAQIGLLIASAPGLLDTLDEIANALGDDPNFATTMTTALSGKLAASAVSGFALTLLDDTTAAAMRTTLGLGTAATAATGDFASSTHGHADATTVASGFMSATDKSKLNGIAAGATANSPDATLLNRANHTGSQAIATVTGLQTALDAKAALTHTHAIGDVTGLTAALAAKADLASPSLTGTPLAPTAATGTNTTQIATTAFVQAQIGLLIASAPGLLDTLDEIANALGDDPNFATTMTTALSGKLAASAVSGFALTLLDDATAADMRTTLGLGTAALATESQLLSRSNHTGTQTAGTISNLSEAIDDRVAALLVAGVNITLTYDDPSNTLTIAAAGGGGGSGLTHKQVMRRARYYQ